MLHRLIRAWLAASALVAALIGAPLSQTRAQDYPTRQITLIVPYPPGGGVDLIGRLVAQRLSAALGQQVVVENRGGAGGMIGTRDLAKAAPDGYTLGVMLTGMSLSPNAGYDVNKDFSPIGLIASTPVSGKDPGRRDRASQEGARKTFGRHATGADHQLLRRQAVQPDRRRRYHDRGLQGYRAPDQ